MRTGAARSTPLELERVAREDGLASSARRTTRALVDAGRRRARERPHRRLDGRRAASSARARSATAASSPRRTDTVPRWLDRLNLSRAIVKTGR